MEEAIKFGQWIADRLVTDPKFGYEYNYDKWWYINKYLTTAELYQVFKFYESNTTKNKKKCITQKKNY